VATDQPVLYATVVQSEPLPDPAGYWRAVAAPSGREHRL